MARRRDPLAPRAAPRPARRDSKQIVDAIVQAMLALDDPDAAMAEIAARAGVGEASLYRYFPTRAAILAEIARRLHDRFLQQVREAVASTDAVELVVRRICETSVRGTGAGPAIRRAINVAIPGAWNAEVVREHYAAIVGELVRWLRARDARAPADLEQRVFVAFSALRGIMLQAMLLPELAPAPDRMIDQMTRTALVIVFEP